MVAFDYATLRDDKVAPLIERFGRDATLRQQANTYDPTTGVATNVPTDTAVKILTLPMSRAKDVFREELIEQFDQFVILGAKETNAAGVEPGTDDILLIDGNTSRIVGITPVAPSGVAVIYKMGIARA